jgi:hypothetical protein
MTKITRFYTHTEYRDELGGNDYMLGKKRLSQYTNLPLSFLSIAKYMWTTLQMKDVLNLISLRSSSEDFKLLLRFSELRMY